MAAVVSHRPLLRPQQPRDGVSWHTQGMRFVKRVAGSLAGSLVPNSTMLRVRFRISLDMLLTVVLTVIAIGLAIGYQVMSRWGARILDSR